MAEEASPKELAETNAATEDMDLEVGENGADLKAKRAREQEDEGNGDVSKKRKLDEDDGEKSVEEQRLDKNLKGEEGNGSGPQTLGPKEFGSAVRMFDYFYKFLHFWPPNVNVNKYEHMVLMDLIQKGHPEPDTKIGVGIQAFQVRYHPTWKSRCFFLIREDETVDDFSFRKCVDHIIPLPEDMKTKTEANKALGGGRGKGRVGKSGGHGRGRGGKWRN